MDVFAVLGKVVATIAPVFIAIVISFWYISRTSKSLNADNMEESILVFIGLNWNLFYLLFMIILSPRIWW